MNARVLIHVCVGFCVCLNLHVWEPLSECSSSAALDAYAIRACHSACRKAWGSNLPTAKTKSGPDAKSGLFHAAADYQSPYAAIPIGTSGRSRKGCTSDSLGDQQDSVSMSSAHTPGPLDDILGQVTDLLSQVNDILGR